MSIPAHLTPDIWLHQFFSSREALSGGVVKRKVRDVERIAGRDMFFEQARRRGYRVWENQQHFIVVCNDDTIKRHV